MYLIRLKLHVSNGVNRSALYKHFQNYSKNKWPKKVKTTDICCKGTRWWTRDTCTVWIEEVKLRLNFASISLRDLVCCAVFCWNLISFHFHSAIIGPYVSLLAFACLQELLLLVWACVGLQKLSSSFELCYYFWTLPQDLEWLSLFCAFILLFNSISASLIYFFNLFHFTRFQMVISFHPCFYKASITSWQVGSFPKSFKGFLVSLHAPCTSFES